MGILSENLKWLRDSLISKSRWGNGQKMIELGDQWLYVQELPYPEYPEKYINHTMVDPILAKNYFVEEGFDHVSLDVNGNATTIKFDLDDDQQRIDHLFQPDVITDFGTSEHCLSLYHTFANLHRMARRSSTLRFHVNPKVGNWPGHGNWYRTAEFYPALCEACGYTLLDNFDGYACGNYTDGWNIMASFVANSEKPFINQLEFNSLPGHYLGPHVAV